MRTFSVPQTRREQKAKLQQPLAASVMVSIPQFVMDRPTAARPNQTSQADLILSYPICIPTCTNSTRLNQIISSQLQSLIRASGKWDIRCRRRGCESQSPVCWALLLLFAWRHGITSWRTFSVLRPNMAWPYVTLIQSNTIYIHSCKILRYWESCVYACSCVGMWASVLPSASTQSSQQMSRVSKLDDREAPFTTCCATSKSTPRNCELNGGPIRLGSQVVLVLVISVMANAGSHLPQCSLCSDPMLLTSLLRNLAEPHKARQRKCEHN